MPIAVTIGADGTVLQGAILLPAGTTIGGSSVAALGVVTSTSATAVAVGRQGATNPVLNVNANAANVVTGVTLVGAAAAAGMAITTTSSGTDEALKIDAKGAGSVTINGTATGKVILGRFVNLKSITVPVAAAGADVSDAGQLGAGNVVHITSDGATKGVKLPTGALGDTMTVINDSATACELYAASGGTVNGLSADSSVVIAASKGVWAQCTAADTWIAFDLPAKATAS
jgi:hypothetical protein